MKSIKKELRNFEIYLDFMRIVRVQFSKKNEVMVDKDNMTYGSFIVNTEIVDDCSEISSFSHDINSFIKKSGLTRRSRLNTKRYRKKKHRKVFKKFRPKGVIFKGYFRRSKSCLITRKISKNYIWVVNVTEDLRVGEEFSPVKKFKDKGSKKELNCEGKIRRERAMSCGSESLKENCRENKICFRKKKKKENLFDILHCEKVKNSGNSLRFNPIGSSLSKNLKPRNYTSPHFASYFP